MDPTSAGARALKKQALDLLVAEQWVIGEAVSRGLRIRGAEVHDRLQRMLSIEFPGGHSELAAFLKSTGQTTSDLDRQTKAKLTEDRLRQRVLAEVPIVSSAQVADYYTRHKENYLISPERKAHFNNTKNRATAVRLKREVEAGKRTLVSPSQREVHEVVTSAHVPPGNAYERAIDSSKPHTVAGPYPIGNDFWLYEVVGIIPARQKSLLEVSASIRRQLTHKRAVATLERFLENWTARWTAKTECSVGYVIPRCKEYRGQHAKAHAFPTL